MSFKPVAPLAAGDAQAALVLSVMALGVVISTQSIMTRAGPGRRPGVDGGTRGLDERLSSSGSSRDVSSLLKTDVASTMGCCLLRVTRFGAALSSGAFRLGGIVDASRAQYPRCCRPRWVSQGASDSTISPPQLTFVQIGEMDKPTDVGVRTHRRKHHTKSSCS